jgi:hypothetical protein
MYGRITLVCPAERSWCRLARRRRRYYALAVALGEGSR